MLDTKILVIDNDAAICDTIKNYFEKEGYEVKTVNDGVLGIDSFKLYSPDIVLLDVMLPKKTVGRFVARSERFLISPSL